MVKLARLFLTSLRLLRGLETVTVRVGDDFERPMSHAPSSPGNEPEASANYVPSWAKPEA